VVPNQPIASLLYSIGFVAVCWVPVWVLYRRGMFIKI
jgi:predicted acyltransferase